MDKAVLSLGNEEYELPLTVGAEGEVGIDIRKLTDGVDANDAPFSSMFPYLAPANIIPEPSGMALMALGLSMLGRRRRPGR